MKIFIIIASLVGLTLLGANTYIMFQATQEISNLNANINQLSDKMKTELDTLSELSTKATDIMDNASEFADQHKLKGQLLMAFVDIAFKVGLEEAWGENWEQEIPQLLKTYNEGGYDILMKKIMEMNGLY